MNRLQKKIQLVFSADDTKFFPHNMDFTKLLHNIDYTKFIEPKRGGIASFVNEAIKWRFLMTEIEFRKFEEKFCNAGGFIP